MLLTKLFLFLFYCPVVNSTMAQTGQEAAVMKLSEKIFQWEVAGKLDSLGAVLDAQLIVVGSDGSCRNKDEYIRRLSDGSFVHNNIEIEEAKATGTGNTAIVAGKGRFTVTSGENRNTVHLSYMEVFSRPDDRAPWKLLAIKANALAN